MRTEKLADGRVKVTRGDGSWFTYWPSVTKGMDFSFILTPQQRAAAAEQRMEEIVEDTLRTLASREGGYFFPEGFRWLRDNFGLSDDRQRLRIATAAGEMARSIFGPASETTR